MMRRRILQMGSVVAAVLGAACVVGHVRADQDGTQSGGVSPRVLVVAQDGSGQFESIQDAINAAGSGDTVRIKEGVYHEDIAVHSKQGLRITGDGVERVAIRGRERFGVFHIGKWPYGATDVKVSGMTIHEHGGLAFGIFNGQRVVLRDLRIKGMLFGQQVKHVRIEACSIGGSETTGLQFADSHAVLVGNFIHDNDHGVTVAGESDIRLERNIITRNLFEGVVVKDKARSVLVSNTIAKNGGGAAFLGESRSVASGNIVGFNRVGFVVGPRSELRGSFNALYNIDADYLRAGSPNIPAPELKAPSDLHVDPRFVDLERSDFRLRPDTPLVQVGAFPYLGALAPVSLAH